LRDGRVRQETGSVFGPELTRTHRARPHSKFGRGVKLVGASGKKIEYSNKGCLALGLQRNDDQRWTNGPNAS
jgi:hypothetical protein